jgi:hemerythrin-like domain-containing protein
MASEIPGSANPFTILKQEHLAIDRLFQSHQEMLLDRSWARALRLLEYYQQLLESHIKFEDGILLPYCIADAIAPIRWKAQIYLAEHRRIEELVNKVRVRLAAIRRRGMKSSMLIGLLDQEGTIKHVLEHHHEREEKGIYDELCRNLSAGERQNLVDTLSRSSVPNIHQAGFN